ncbi:hypothetical protein EDC96DRAFT_477537 [Choanephora cucurbitarum]|nr:hypothetical protein EDC96DRAFT_477537 [Choanephora cucurbitarum]
MAFSSTHANYIKSLYKRLLSESSLFFDDRTRLFIQQRTREGFHDYKQSHDLIRVKYKIREARKFLHRLEKANRGHQKEAMKILSDSYGRSGKTRHVLLYPYLHGNRAPIPPPLVPHAPRTAPPPPLCPPLCALVLQDLNKPLVPQLPTPEFKPLHPGRQANLLWRHRSMLLQRIQPPLPFEIIVELESKAGATSDHPLSCAFQTKGGPRWHALYAHLTHAFFDPTSHHLSPYAKLVPSSLFIRQQPLLDSPYSYRKLSLVESLEPKPLVPPPIPYTERQKRRLYQKLLAKIPLIDLIQDVWQQKNDYTVSRSHWVPKATHQLLRDPIPSHVIQATLKKNKKK